MARSQFALLLTGAASLAVASACGPEFTGVDRSSGGSGGGDGAGKATAGAAAEAGRESGGRNSGTAGHAGSSVTGGAGKGGTAAQGGSAPNTGGVVNLGGSVNIGGLVNGGSGGVVIAPDAVPQDGLELWLRADQGITETNGAVAVWKDASGHKRDASQTDPKLRPTLVADALSGKPALVFDSVDDFLQLPTLDADFGKGVSMFVALDQYSNTACQAYFEASNSVGTTEIDDLHFGAYKNALLFEVQEKWINDETYPILLGAPQIAVAIQEPEQLTRLRSNGNAAGQGTTDAVPSAKRGEVYIGKTLYGDCTYFSGTIGEMLIYSRAVSDAELLDIEAYLQKKWGCCDK